MHRKQIREVEQYVYEKLQEEGSGHDWWHIERVRKNAIHIAKTENADCFVVELASLLHDLIDDKLTDTIKMSKKQVEDYLMELGVDRNTSVEVMNCIKLISYRKKIPKDELSLEAKVVQDADRLDAIGAIGIARTFTYAGSEGNLIYNPNGESETDAISHFYDKLLNLKNLMNTKTGKNLAEERHQFLQIYLEQFYKEWDSVN